MPSEVILPRVDMDMTTGKISRWFVEQGAEVTKGQPLFEIETDKAAMEIEAPETGTIRDLAAASGADIPVGSVVAWIDRAGERAAPGGVDASGVHTTPDRPPEPKAEPLPATVSRAGGSSGAGLGVSSRTSEGERASASPEPPRPRATPMARRLAREQGLALADLRGSGPRGRIQARDVEDATRPLSAHAAGNAGEDEPDLPLSENAPASGRAGALNLVGLREGAGRPILLIHGFGADANTWRPFLSGRQASQPVYALDLPGHGASPLGTAASFAALVDAAEEALLGAGLDAFDLVGHSLGGGVAGALAGRGTLDIRSLLLIAPAGLGPEVNGGFVRGFLDATSEASLMPWMRELVVDPSVITLAFVKSTLRTRDGSALVTSQRRIAEAVFPDGTQAFSIRPDLARLAMPTRIVFGAADRIIPASHASGLPGLIALHRLPNIGHMPQVEASGVIAEILAQMTG